MTSWHQTVQRDAGSDEHDATPNWIGGVPLCTDACPHYDGKRCRVLGMRAPDLCEPVVVQMSRMLDGGE